MNKTDIENALNSISAKQSKYDKFERYYKGDHDLAFATEKFKNAFGDLFREFALNLCTAVVDAPKDKLKISNFSVEAASTDGSTTTKDIPAEAWKIWQNNRMGLRSGIIHKEALKLGDAYVIVWTDSEGKVTIYPQKSKNCMVAYDEEMPGKKNFAAKIWTIQDTSANAKPGDRRVRLDMYYPNQIEKYIAKKKGTGIPKKADDFQEYTESGSSVVKNPYGIVPMFHFANNADIGADGSSELSPARPVQDALNKTVLDLMVAMEFISYPQRWATGIEAEYDDEGNPKAPFMAGIERLWMSESPETKFGSFTVGDLKQFLEVKESFRTDMACVTGTPLYYFMLTSANFPSGESLKKSETRFINKVSDRMESFGAIWEEIFSFALLMENKGKGIRLFVVWEEPEPISEKEKLENILVKKEIGIDDEQALIEAGYGEDDIKKIEERKQTKAEDALNAFNSGE